MNFQACETAEGIPEGKVSNWVGLCRTVEMQLPGGALAWHVEGPGFYPSTTKKTNKKEQVDGGKRKKKSPQA